MTADLLAENLRLQSQLDAECERTIRAYGVIGQMACHMADNYAHDFSSRDIEHGLEACRVDDDGRHFLVSTMGS